MSGPLSTNAPFSNFGQTMILRDIEQLYLLVGERNGDMGDAGYGTSSVGQYGPGSDLKGPNKGVKNPSTAGGSIVKYLGTLDVPVFGGSISVAGSAAGVGAVDWQQFRGTSAQVASGAYSIIAGGSNNTADGISSTVLGGSSNWAISDFSIAGGYNSWAGNVSGLPSVAIGYNMRPLGGAVGIGYSPTTVSIGAGSIAINSQSSTASNSIAIGAGASTATSGDISIAGASNSSSIWSVIIGGNGTFAPGQIRIGDTTNSSSASYIIGSASSGVDSSFIFSKGGSNCTSCVSIGGTIGAISTSFKPVNVTHIGPPSSGCYNNNSAFLSDTVSLGGGMLGTATPGINKSLVYTSTLNGVAIPYSGGTSVCGMTRSVLIQGSPEASWFSTAFLTNSVRIWSDGASLAREFGAASNNCVYIGGFIQKEISYVLDVNNITSTVSLACNSLVNKNSASFTVSTITNCAFIGGKKNPNPLSSTVYLSFGTTATQNYTGCFLGTILDSSTDDCVAIKGTLGVIGTATTLSNVVVVGGSAKGNLTNHVIIGADWDGTSITNSIAVVTGNIRANNLGCNGKAPQAASSVPSAVTLTAGATYTATEQVMLGDLKAMCNSLRTALINNGICV